MVRGYSLVRHDLACGRDSPCEFEDGPAHGRESWGPGIRTAVQGVVRKGQSVNGRQDVGQRLLLGIQRAENGQAIGRYLRLSARRRVDGPVSWLAQCLQVGSG